jgi:Fur family ferric uptake transcriptional regulator
MTSADLLRERGLRVTTARVVVLDALTAHPHGTAADVSARFESRAAGARLSRQGLYNVLDDLWLAGLLRRIEPAGSAARYEVRVGDNHHHMVCRDCGLVADVDCVTGSAPCLDPSDLPTDFVLDEAEVVWWGTCGNCGRADALPATVLQQHSAELPSEGETE